MIVAINLLIRKQKEHKLIRIIWLDITLDLSLELLFFIPQQFPLQVFRLVYS